MPMTRSGIWFPGVQDDWYCYRIAENSTLSFGGAVREVTETHPDFIADMIRLETDSEFAARYPVRVDVGRAIRKSNIRRGP